MLEKLRNRKGESLAFAISFTVLSIGIGHYMYQKGDWGKDGRSAIKNCVGTHINGNCHHDLLNKADRNGGNVEHN